MKDRQKIWARRLGYRPRVDVVICGPPGAGKTCLIAALASGSGLPERRSIAPIEDTAERIETVYRHLKSGDRGPVSNPEGPWHVQVSGDPISGDGTQAEPSEPTREIAFLELDSELSNEHPLHREISFAPVWVLLLDTAGAAGGWYWDRLHRWSRELALPDGEVAERPVFPPSDRRFATVMPRELRRNRKIVVVLTRLDEAVGRWKPFFGALPGLPGPDLGRERLDDFARHLDGEAWIHHLYPGLLERIRSLLGGPFTEILVGLTSAVGWQPPMEASPEWRPFGTGAVLQLVLGQSPQNPLRRMEPSGPRRPGRRLDTLLTKESGP